MKELAKALAKALEIGLFLAFMTYLLWMAKGGH